MKRATAPLPPTPAPPVPPETVAALTDLAAGLDAQQLWWASGYLAGLGAHGEAAPQTAPATQTAGAWTIYYATETGNARHLAAKLAERALEQGVAARTVDLHGFKPSRLKREERAWFIVSTHGLGDPPEGYEDFFEFVHGERAPQLEQLEYAVLALGDSSYEDFCEVGKRLDERLAALGATDVLERVDCDLDFDADADEWIGRVIAKARESASDTTAAPALPFLQPVPSRARFSRDNPYQAEVLVNQPITGRDSTKIVHHLELSREDAGLDYLPGDALGVVSVNPPRLVDEILAVTGLTGSEPVTVKDETVPLDDALRERLEITVLNKRFLESYAQASGATPLIDLLASPDRGALREYLLKTQIVDVLHAAPTTPGPQQFVDWLRALTPRLYSIASSPDANPDEIHLTVARTEYTKHDRRHWGSASVYLTDEPTSAPVFVEAKPNFRLPGDGSTPIIMIGPGTGVAPFRAFIEQRAEHGTSGRNWLFFGDRTFKDDFLYQIEWQRYLKDGVLTRLDLAFSRDQAEKIYVQDRIAARARDLVAWLEDGAHVYVCGDAEAMAPAVDEALRNVLAAELCGTRDKAEAYLRDLKRNERYQRDVY